MNVLARPFLYFTLTYLLTIGATFNGVLMPNVRLLSAALLGIITAGWVVTKLRVRWTAHRTALDTAFVLWAAAFLLSTLGNLDLWHRIRVGLWFVGAYIAAWYLLHDLIAQRPSLRRAAADALLIAGGLALLIGFAQVQGWFAALPSAIAQGLPVILPRPGSIIGNPNALAALLVITLPLAAVRLAERKPLIRVLMAVYCAGAITLIALTFSRGAWIGAVAAGCVTVALSLARLDPRQVWRSASQVWRRLIIGMAVVALLMFTVLRSIWCRAWIKQAEERRCAPTYGMRRSAWWGERLFPASGCIHSGMSWRATVRFHRSRRRRMLIISFCMWRRNWGCPVCWR